MPGKPGQPGPSSGNHISLLRLLPGYLANPEAFVRPGPPPSRPLPLQFVCRACGQRVQPEASRCGRCNAKLYVEH